MCQKYEAIFIIKENKQENKTREIINEINSIVENYNGKIYYKDEKGICNLAYEIKGNKKAFFYYIDFKNIENKELELGKIAIKLNTIEEILKHIMLKLEDN